MAMLAERAECSNVAVNQAGTAESTALSAHQVFSIDFQQGFVAMISPRLTFSQSELWVWHGGATLR
jgi:hypothetical protein